MNFNIDHEHFVAKNRSLAAAYDVEERARRRANPERSGEKRNSDASCFSCKSKNKCPEFRAKRSGGTSGVVSFGGGSEAMRCTRYEAAPSQSRSMSDKQIKSLMRNFKRAC